MPFVICQFIDSEVPALWGEGQPYSSKKIYSINSPTSPPVNYSSHTLCPHSFCHVDGPNHIIENAGGVETYFSDDRIRLLYGAVTVLKFKSVVWKKIEGQAKLFHHEVSLQDLKDNILRVQGRVDPPKKLIFTVDDVPVTSKGQHHPDYAITLSEDAASWLSDAGKLEMLGTSWKSTDFQPHSRERPIHKAVLKSAVILECLDLRKVPEGQFFISAFPIPILGASESPVCPVLFTAEEMQDLSKEIK